MRSKLPGQPQLLLAALLLVVGAWLPWVYTFAGPVSGIRGGGRVIFYVGILALAGGMLPARWSVAALVQAVVCAVPAFVLPVWQVGRLISLVGTQGWAPGPGLIMTLGGGVLCAIAARRLASARSATAAL